MSVAETAGTSEAGTGRQAGLQLAHAVLYALLFSSQLGSSHIGCEFLCSLSYMLAALLPMRRLGWLPGCLCAGQLP